MVVTVVVVVWLTVIGTEDVAVSEMVDVGVTVL